MDRCIQLAISFLFTASCGPSTIRSQVTLSPPPGGVCYGDVVELLCQPTGETAQYLIPTTFWRENTIPLRVGPGTPYALQDVNTSGDKLIINITGEYFEENTVYSYQCFYIFHNSSDESGVVIIDPLEHPTPPTLREPITTTPSTVTLEVDHRNTCFENCTFQYEVKVHPAGSHMSISTTTHSTNVFNVSGLSGGTRYRAEIVAVCVEESTIRSDPLNVNFTTRMEDGTTVTPTTPPDNGTDPTSGTDSTNGTDTTDGPSLVTDVGLIAGVVMACIVVILVTIAVIIVVVSLVVFFTCKKERDGDSQRRGSGEVDEDKKNSTPFYMNVEMDDGSVPMTTNPTYGKVKLTGDHSRAVYANL